jgi:hypothetical protein
LGAIYIKTGAKLKYLFAVGLLSLGAWEYFIFKDKK